MEMLIMPSTDRFPSARKKPVNCTELLGMVWRAK